VTVRKLDSNQELRRRSKDRAGTDWIEWPLDLRIKEFPATNESLRGLSTRN